MTVGSGKKVLVAMSGGVDSSVTAALLKNQGYDVVGIHMQLWDAGADNFERIGARCCSMVDSNDARRVCDRLDIPYYMINAQDVFQAEVVDYFVHEYLQTRTPNPCVQCNTKIKFNYLFQKADELGCDFIATGHYAQVIRDESSGNCRLTKGIDNYKDQSYFLFGLSQKALQRLLMPIGGFTKEMVRRMADQFELNNAEKADSQDICFIGHEGYAGFIEKNTAKELREEGPVRNVKGEHVGQHNGLFRYTIGQRKGLGVPTRENEALYVVGFDYTENALIVGAEEYLFQHDLLATKVNWLQPFSGLQSLKCKARIRAKHVEAECMINLFENDTVHVRFKEPQRALTPGQAVVFYKGDEVLGGGFIDRVGIKAQSAEEHADYLEEITPDFGS